MRLPTSAALPASIFAIVLGVLGLFATLIYLIVSYGHFVNTGPRLALPDDATALTLRPDTEYVVYQEINGSHVTVNRPYVPFPEDFGFEAADADTDEAIGSTDFRWRMRIAFFGLQDKREAVAQFTSPPSGRVRLRFTNVPEHQVVYVGLSETVYRAETLPRIQIGAAASFLCVIGGVVFVLLHLNRRSSISLERPHTDAA